jgi:hypothetical protein
MQVDAVHRMSLRFLALAVQHYIRFNLHDVARVFQAMVRANVASLTTAEDIFVLWKHEIQRAVLDKLPTLDDYTAAWEVLGAHPRAFPGNMFRRTQMTCSVNTSRFISILFRIRTGAALATKAFLPHSYTHARIACPPDLLWRMCVPACTLAYVLALRA